MMWQWQGLKVFAVNYARFLAFPLALVVGTIGYKLEEAYSNKSTPWKESVIERRNKRREESEDQEFTIPTNIFDRYQQPSGKK